MGTVGTELSTSLVSLQVGPDSHADRILWYGIRTRPNHERVATIGLRGKGYEAYLPLYRLHRSRTGEHPLFPGYVFCAFDVKKRLPILMTAGVISVLGFGKEPAAIPD